MVEEEDAYKIHKVSVSSKPIFKNIDATYILTMEDSNRFEKLEKRIFELSKRTFLQINKGFKKFTKKDVNSTCKDIVHACKNVCKHAAKYENILILEDDAIIKNMDDIKSFKNVDKFIKENKFNVYSLGSIGFVIPTNSILHYKFLGFLGFAQSNIYSKNIRKELLNTSIRNINHIDAHFISKYDLKYTYYKPLIVQYFTNTENMKEWGWNERKLKIEIAITKLFIFFLQDILHLDRQLWGWNIIYTINHLPIIVLSGAICSFII